MTTSTKKKLTALEKVQRSLNSAAKILNRKMHQPNHSRLTLSDDKAAAVAEFEKIILYQVWCVSQQKVVSSPSTDKVAQQKFSTKHDQMFGHTSQVIATT